MKDLMAHLLDIVQNAIQAEASKISIELYQTNHWRTLTISDDGVGMRKCEVTNVTSPFVTSKPSKQTGLGIPLLAQAAECTGGALSISSQLGVGTKLSACFFICHPDCKPLGDVPKTLALLFITCPKISFSFHWECSQKEQTQIFTVSSLTVKDLGYQELYEFLKRNCIC